MPSGYDEMTDRAFADYAGGTPEERARRALLRQAMEKQDFQVIPKEWWHFDYNRSNGTRDADRLIRVGQRGAEDLRSASRSEGDRSPAAAGRPG